VYGVADCTNCWEAPEPSYAESVDTILNDIVAVTVPADEILKGASKEAPFGEYESAMVEEHVEGTVNTPVTDEVPIAPPDTMFKPVGTQAAVLGAPPSPAPIRVKLVTGVAKTGVAVPVRAYVTE